jgi:Co/Zn/Cd efflux system component
VTASQGSDSASAATRRAVLIAGGSANLLVTAAKLVAGILTGSSAMLAETVHSAADTLNQAFLLTSVHRSERPADAGHPFGYGQERYVWSLLAAQRLDHVRSSPDTTVKAALFEDTAALAGLILAAVGLLLRQLTGSPVWDGAASIAIGALLVVAADAEDAEDAEDEPNARYRERTSGTTVRTKTTSAPISC